MQEQYSKLNLNISFEDFLYKTSSHYIVELAIEKLAARDVVFALDDNLKRIYRLLTYYFLNDYRFENFYFETSSGKKIAYSLKKGLLLMSNPGAGKTFLMEQIFKIFTNRLKINQYKIISSFDIANDFENYGAKAMRQFELNSLLVNNKDTKTIDYRNCDLYIDEVGAEAKTVQHYANKHNPIETVLHERYRIFTNIKKRTHMSTNLKLYSNNDLSLKTMYGDRIYSRIFEMFNIVNMNNFKDLRIITF